jgi:hypothetical protein
MTSDESSRTSLTRRQLALLVGAVPLAARTGRASAQAAAQPQQTVASPVPVDARAKAQDDIRKNSDLLRQIELPTDAEPAFIFHP